MNQENIKTPLIPIPFGIYQGKTLQEINQINHQYVTFLATRPSYGKEPFKTIVQEASKLTTTEERRRLRKQKKYHNQKTSEVNWLIKFLTQEMLINNSTFSRRFCQTLRIQLCQEHRIDHISFKQMKIICDIWSKRKSGEYDRNDRNTSKYLQAKENFKSKFKGKWTRKNNTLDDI